MTTNCRSRRLGIAACAASLALALGGSAAAQSLGDVAREEAARRGPAAPTKVYTNADLATPDSTSVAAVSPAQSAGAPAASAEKSSAEKGGAGQGGAPSSTADGKKDGKGEPTKKDEAYWRARIKAAREGKARAESFAEALQSRINALSADFVNRDDPAQRNAIAADRQKALDELARVKKEIVDFAKAIDEVQTEARHEGVPAGWVR